MGDILGLLGWAERWGCGMGIVAVAALLGQCFCDALDLQMVRHHTGLGPSQLGSGTEPALRVVWRTGGTDLRLDAALLLATLAIAGCTPSGMGPSESAPGLPASPGESIAFPSLPDGLTDADLVTVTELASTDTGVQIEEIRVVTAEAVTWSDGSLGCPEEGQMYTQALVPGYRVVLDVAGEELAYHASETGDFRACANPIAPVEDGRVDKLTWRYRESQT
jgi:hypothetical protein